MKIHLIKFLFSIIILSSCSTQNEQEILGFESEKIAENQVRKSPPEVIPMDLAIFNMVADTKNYNLEDIDLFYKQELPLHKGKAYYENLRAFIISGLIHQHNILEKGSNDLVAYYIEEQLDMTLSISNIPNFSLFLEKMDGHWDKNKIKMYGDKFIKKAEVSLNQMSQKEPLTKEKKDLESLKAWIQEL